MTHRELRIALEKISEGEFAEFVKAFGGGCTSPRQMSLLISPSWQPWDRRAKEQLDKQLQGVV